MAAGLQLSNSARLLVALTSAVFLGSKSLVPHDHILLPDLTSPIM
jgi:hypothetical protein